MANRRMTGTTTETADSGRDIAVQALEDVRRTSQRILDTSIATEIDDVLADVSSFMDLTMWESADDVDLQALASAGVLPNITPWDGGDIEGEMLIVNLAEKLGSSAYADLSTRLIELHSRLDNVLASQEPVPGDVRQVDPASLAEIRHTTGDIRGFLLTQLDNLVQRYGSTIDSRRVLRMVEETVTPVRREIARKLVDARARAAAERAERAAEAAEESAGISGTASLASFFESFAKREMLEARFWQVLTFGGLAMAAWAAYSHIFSVAELDWIDIARRMAVGIPIAVAISIALREASVHRRHEMWAHHFVVQLQTIRAFTQELPSSQRTSIRYRFGKIVFAGPPEFERIPRARRRLTGEQTDLVAEVAGSVAKEVAR